MKIVQRVPVTVGLDSPQELLQSISPGMSVEVSDRFPGAEVRVMDFAVLSDTLDVSSWDAVVIISVKAHSPGAQQLGLVP